MRDDFGIGLALEAPATPGERLAQRLEILDDAVVDERDLARRVRVRVARRRRAVGRPARVCDANEARRGVAAKFLDEIAELTLGAATDQLAALDRAHARRIIAAIFHALQPVDEAVRHLRSEEHTSELQTLMRN